MMRASLMAGLLAGSLLPVTPGAFAQAVVPGPVVAAPEPFDIAPEEEMVVREYIIRRRPPPPMPMVVAPAPAPAPAVVIRPGSIIPADVLLEPFDESPIPALRRYSYFISPSNKIVVVDPLERRVIRILDQ
jgi:hypothetical protein